MLAQKLIDLLRLAHVATDYLSLDDYYLASAELQAKQHKTGYIGYRWRGLPGTHDVKLLFRHLMQLQENCSIQVPIYDKLARNGQGEKTAALRQIKNDNQVLIIEGWMLGFLPQSNDQIPSSVHLINTELIAYKKIWDLINIWLLLRVDRVRQHIYQWRWEAELVACQVRQLPSPNRMQLDSFIENFLPAYDLYYNDLPHQLRTRYKPANIWEFDLEDDRSLKMIQNN